MTSISCKRTGFVRKGGGQGARFGGESNDKEEKECLMHDASECNDG